MLVGLAVSLRCGFEHDATTVVTTVSVLAGPNATDCGFASQYQLNYGEGSANVERVRACMRTALEEGTRSSPSFPRIASVQMTLDQSLA